MEIQRGALTAFRNASAPGLKRSRTPFAFASFAGVRAPLPRFAAGPLASSPIRSHSAFAADELTPPRLVMLTAWVKSAYAQRTVRSLLGPGVGSTVNCAL